MVRRWHFGSWMALLAALAALSGCSTVRLEARPNIPQPLIVKIPISIGLFMPLEFSSYVYKSDRYGYNWEVTLGAAQSDGVQRLLAAMFEKVVPVDNLGTAQTVDPGIRAIFEPTVEDFAFVTPRDAGTQFYAVSIKYRINVYTPDGRLAESWPFTGYGIVPATGLSAQKPLALAAAAAMRDAGAKLVVEFREQAVVRGLLPAPQPDSVGDAAGAGATTPPVTGQPAAPAPVQETPAPATESSAPGDAASAPETQPASESQVPVEAVPSVAGPSGRADAASQQPPSSSDP